MIIYVIYLTKSNNFFFLKLRRKNSKHQQNEVVPILKSMGQSIRWSAQTGLSHTISFQWGLKRLCSQSVHYQHELPIPGPQTFSFLFSRPPKHKFPNSTNVDFQFHGSIYPLRRSECSLVSAQSLRCQLKTKLLLPSPCIPKPFSFLLKISGIYIFFALNGYPEALVSAHCVFH